MTSAASFVTDLVETIVSRFDPDAVLGRVGLERRRSAATSLIGPAAALGAGLAAGVYAKDVLEALGLRRARSSLPTVVVGIGILAAGAVVGAGVGLALAPTSGREFRTMLAKRFDELKGRLVEVEKRSIEKIPGRATPPAGAAVEHNHAESVVRSESAAQNAT